MLHILTAILRASGWNACMSLWKILSYHPIAVVPLVVNIARLVLRVLQKARPFTIRQMERRRKQPARFILAHSKCMNPLLSAHARQRTTMRIRPLQVLAFLMFSRSRQRRKFVLRAVDLTRLVATGLLESGRMRLLMPYTIRLTEQLPRRPRRGIHLHSW